MGQRDHEKVTLHILLVGIDKCIMPIYEVGISFSFSYFLLGKK
jgi:hypothetical protein